MLKTLVKSGTMTRERILVIDDEEDLLELVNYNLTREGFRVECVAETISCARALPSAETLVT